MKFILLNGPPGVGKSEEIAPRLYHELVNAGHHTVRESFAKPMKDFIASALGMNYRMIAKNSPNGYIKSYTPREFLIDLSETYMKPRYGHDIWALLMLHRIGQLDPQPQFVVVDDMGFPEEVKALEMFKPIIVHVTRPGHTFQKDSRNFVGTPDHVIVNDGDLDQLALRVKLLASVLCESHKHGARS